jgi:hypothetical protein
MSPDGVTVVVVRSLAPGERDRIAGTSRVSGETRDQVIGGIGTQPPGDITADRGCMPPDDAVTTALTCLNAG